MRAALRSRPQLTCESLSVLCSSNRKMDVVLCLCFFSINNLKHEQVIHVCTLQVSKKCHSCCPACCPMIAVTDKVCTTVGVQISTLKCSSSIMPISSRQCFQLVLISMDCMSASFIDKEEVSAPKCSEKPQ